MFYYNGFDAYYMRFYAEFTSFGQYQLIRHQQVLLLFKCGFASNINVDPVAEADAFFIRSEINNCCKKNVTTAT